MPEMFKAPPQHIFGGPRDRSYPAPVELLHVSIFHTGPGIDELVNFYQVALNMRYVFHMNYGEWEFIAISNDDENHRLGFVNVQGDVVPGSAGSDLPEARAEPGQDLRQMPLRPCRIEHTSWLYRDFESVLLTAKRIHEELGIWPRTCRHQGIDITMDYADPDGNRVEMLTQFKSRGEILFDFYCASQAAPEQRKEFAQIYMPMNMEKLIALYESGVTIPQLQDREYCREMIKEGKL